ncbi:hypothetical protein L2E82_50721 [Cichorium intybus]|nr:hypothetical protein L2E82_50721 [Cichorium intybus]
MRFEASLFLSGFNLNGFPVESLLYSKASGHEVRNSSLADCCYHLHVHQQVCLVFTIDYWEINLCLFHGISNSKDSAIDSKTKFFIKFLVFNSFRCLVQVGIEVHDPPGNEFLERQSGIISLLINTLFFFLYNFEYLHIDLKKSIRYQATKTCWSTEKGSLGIHVKLCN